MSSQHPVLAPEDIPVIAVETMNDTHHEEVMLVNELGTLLLQAKGETTDIPAITAALDAWVEHTKAHFERENQLMQEYGFPPYQVHAQEHDSAMTRLLDVQGRWKDEQSLEALEDFVFNHWRQWFDMHVNSMDNITAQFLSNFVA